MIGEFLKSECFKIGDVTITWKADKNVSDNSAQHVTTVGVMFTFIGIIYALWDFDVENITKSIPPFLEGMKTAFITSIII